MDLCERVYSLLVVSAHEKFNNSLAELFPDLRHFDMTFKASAGAACRALAEKEYDFVIINSPLPDDSGIQLAVDISAKANTVVTMLVRNEIYASVFEKVSSHGVYTLPKPTSRQIMIQALDWMISTREKLKKLEKKTLSLEDKMLEIRIVNRAKWLLITALNMSESDAHRYIEKQAMDKCISKKEVAEAIISTYS